jgi:hypothetical protein|tara:strand:+ start:685 stop:873 length:189 start_codon:yes stop_codon:yes gene_type:complete
VGNTYSLFNVFAGSLSYPTELDNRKLHVYSSKTDKIVALKILLKKLKQVSRPAIILKPMSKA